jgi:hypothetical protein
MILDVTSDRRYSSRTYCWVIDASFESLKTLIILKPLNA